MKKLLITILFSALVLPAMAESSQTLEKILADKKESIHPSAEN